MGVKQGTRRTSKTDMSIEKVYKSFINSSEKNKQDLSNQTRYTSILVALFNRIFHYIIYEGYEFTYRKLGTFSCIKYLPSVRETNNGYLVSNKPIDFAATSKKRKETGNNKIYVYYDNSRTGGYTYKVIWDKSRTSFLNMTFYKFALQRNLRKLLSNAAISGEAMARHVDFKV